MFESCHTPYEVAHLLRMRYGFPVELFAGRPFVTCGPTIEAIAMPAGLGRRVRATLRDAPTVPAVADPRNQRCVFLVAPPHPYRGVDQRFHRPLALHGVIALPFGHRVLLPTSDYPLGWHWVGEPSPGPLRLPCRATLLSAAREAIRQDAAHVPA
jgi:hypothetical protein